MKMKCMGLLAILFVIYVSNLAGEVNAGKCITSAGECKRYLIKLWKTTNTRIGYQGCKGYSFAGNYGTKGCYAYGGGKYDGCGFFGYGGSTKAKCGKLSGSTYRISKSRWGKKWADSRSMATKWDKDWFKEIPWKCLSFIKF